MPAAITCCTEILSTFFSASAPQLDSCPHRGLSLVRTSIFVVSAPRPSSCPHLDLRLARTAEHFITALRNSPRRALLKKIEFYLGRAATLLRTRPPGHPTMSKNTSGGGGDSPVMSSPESSTGFMSPPGGGGAKLTPAPAGLVSQIPGQQKQHGTFAGYGIGLHGPVHGAGPSGGDQYAPKPAASAHQGPWGVRPGGPAYDPWGAAPAADDMAGRRPAYAANPAPPRAVVTDHSPTRPAPGRFVDAPSAGSSASPAEHCYKVRSSSFDLDGVFVLQADPELRSPGAPGASIPDRRDASIPDGGDASIPVGPSALIPSSKLTFPRLSETNSDIFTDVSWACTRPWTDRKSCPRLLSRQSRSTS